LGQLVYGIKIDLVEKILMYFWAWFRIECQHRHLIS